MLSNFCHQCLSLVSYCRTHCYKIILVVVIFFFFSQYAMNLIVKNKIPKIISPSLSWVSSLSAQKILGLNIKSDTEVEASRRTIVNISEANANNSTAFFLTRENSSHSAIEESLAKLTTSFNISTIARSKLPLCPLVPPNLGNFLFVITYKAKRVHFSLFYIIVLKIFVTGISTHFENDYRVYKYLLEINFKFKLNLNVGFIHPCINNRT